MGVKNSVFWDVVVEVGVVLGRGGNCCVWCVGVEVGVKNSVFWVLCLFLCFCAFNNV